METSEDSLSALPKSSTVDLKLAFVPSWKSFSPISSLALRMSARKCLVVIQAQATARLQALGFVNERQMSERFDA